MSLAGAHDSLTGIEKIGDVIEIDQSPIGRSPRSNPATYVGFYDDIRQLFASVPLSVERGYTASRFSFNVKGGRCEECSGEGTITTKLNFMPDVEASCHACKGSRYNPETLEVLYNGKSIADVLAMSIEDGAAVLHGAQEDRPQAACPRRSGSRLSHPGPPRSDSLRRRGAARQARHRAGQDQARCQEPLYLGRADDGLAPRRYPAAFRLP